MKDTDNLVDYERIININRALMSYYAKTIIVL